MRPPGEPGLVADSQEEETKRIDEDEEPDEERGVRRGRRRGEQS